MGVLDGQPVSQGITNPAFINKNQDDVMPNKLGLARALSGASIADIQSAVNKLYLASGASESTTGTAYTAPAGTISIGDDYELALSKLAQKFDASTGHMHTGSPGDGPLLPGSGLGGVPLMGFMEKAGPIGFSGSSTDVSSLFFGKTPSTGGDITGVITVSPYNEVSLESSASGGLFVDSGGNVVYGKLTESAGTWVVGFYSKPSGVETAYTFPSAATGSFYYQELFKPLQSTTIYSQDARLRNLTQPVSGAGGGGGGGGGFTEIDMVNGATGAVTGFLVNSAQFNGFVAEYSILRVNSIQSDGSEDTGFYTQLTSLGDNSGLNGTVLSLAELSDSSLIVGGGFTSLNSDTAYSRLIKLDSTGFPASGFSANLGTGPSNLVFALGVQSSGSIVAGGSFTSVNAVTRHRIVRVDSSGNDDSTFYSNVSAATGSAFNDNVRAIGVQSNDYLVIGGSFNTLNSLTRRHLVRLDSTGVEDTSFYTNLTSTGDNSGFPNSLAANVLCVLIQPSDGSIVAGGDFTALNGATRNRMVRLAASGTEDSSFYTNLTSTGDNSAFDAGLDALGIQSDGKIIVGGSFTTLNGATRNRLVRLNTDGSEDSTFYTQLTSLGDNSGLDGAVLAIAIEPDDRIVIGGSFTALNGVTRNRIARLMPDGTPDDSAFNDNIPSGFNASAVQTILEQTDGAPVIGGSFTTFNGNTRNSLVRLASAGSEEKREVGTFWGSYSPAASGWEISDPIGAFGPSGVVLGISSPGAAGQVTYDTSPAIPGIVVQSKLRFIWRGL